VLIGEEWHDLGPGDVVFVPAGTRHSYANAGEVPFKFLCTVPASRLMP
jgi:quercetin dioxygenase-like cupin family protein